jgi:hypothetical protein
MTLLVGWVAAKLLASYTGQYGTAPRGLFVTRTCDRKPWAVDQGCMYQHATFAGCGMALRGVKALQAAYQAKRMPIVLRKSVFTIPSI